MIPGSANPLLLKSAAAAGGLQIERSLRFNSSDSAYLSRTPAVAGTRTTWTWSGWVKRGGLGAVYQNILSAANSGNDRYEFYFTPSNELSGEIRIGGTGYAIYTTPLYRDPSAWYHLVVVMDTPQYDPADRHKIYINGTQVTNFSSASYPPQNSTPQFNAADPHSIGRYQNGAAQYFDGYLTNIHFIDGQALTPSSFTETDATTGQLIPKTYTGTYGLVSVAAATGALPIFNTTDTYGAVKGTGTRTDTNSASIVLALPMDGTNGGTSFGDQSAVIKGSGSAKTVTVNGNSNTSTAQSKFYGSSGYFDGTGDYLTIPAQTDFAFGTGDFTVECYVYQVARSPYQTHLAGSQTYGVAGDWLFVINAAGTLAFQIGNSATGSYTSTSLVPLNVWTHVSLSRQSGVVRGFINGVDAGGSLTYSTSIASVIVFSTGSDSGGNANSSLNGYLQDVRVYKGVAKYTGNFSPVVSSNNSFNLLFADNSSNTASTLGKDTSGLSNNWTPNNFSTSTGGPTSVAAASGALPIFNTTDTYGGIKGTGTRTDTNASSLSLCVPMGTATGLSLTDEQPTGRTSSSSTLTNTGVTNSTSVSKFYGGSALFSASRLDTTATSDFLFGTGDFTVEGWFYQTGSPLYPAILEIGAHLGVNGIIFIPRENSTGGACIYSGAFYGNGLVQLNTWNHIAWTRASGVLKIFVNGVLSSSAAFTNNLTDTTGDVTIGTRHNGDSQYNYPGYIQDLRVYKGLAKYTGNFNPPSSTANATIAAGNDSLVDSPTNYGTDTYVGGEVRGNYATLNPLDKAVDVTLANGNLDISHSGSSNLRAARATIKLTTGKWYCEAVRTTGSDCHSGIITASSSLFQFASTSVFYGEDGALYVNGSVVTNYGITIAINDVVGIAVDMDAAKIYFYKNGTLINTGGTSFTTTGNDWFFKVGTYFSGSVNTVNFGQRAFAHPLSTYKALCTENLPEGTITTSGTYTGNGVADGPFVYLNGVPTAMTVGINAVTFGTDADKLSNGFKLRTTNVLYNQNALSYSYSITTTGAKFKYARAQPNP